MLTTIDDIEMEFAIMTIRIKQALIDNEIDIDTLIQQLRATSAVRTKNVPLLDEEVFDRITSIDDLWKSLSRFWTLFDYDLLRFIVKITKCEEAKSILDEFLSGIDPAIIEDVDLVLECQKYEKPGSLKPILRIKVNVVKCTPDVKKKVKEAVSEKYNLNEYSICFKGIREGCIELLYHVSKAVMVYLLQCKVTRTIVAELSACKIIGICINDVDSLVSS